MKKQVLIGQSMKNTAGPERTNGALLTSGSTPMMFHPSKAIDPSQMAWDVAPITGTLPSCQSPSM